VSGEEPLEAVHERMRAAVVGPADGRRALYRWLSYHLGWADAFGQPAENRRGKGIRPRLCLIACAAVGADIERAIGAAAAVELTHEFSLVHDDIQDGDQERRGQPALWTIIGIPQAINAGDALYGIARRQISVASDELAPEVVVDLIRRYDQACIRLVEGQFLDIAFETTDAITVDDYVTMVHGKTGALLGAAAGLGARSGGASPDVADAFTRYGEALGAGFQMQDDVLGLWGDPALTGKPAGNDLARRKKSLPLILALADPVLGPELAPLYATPQPPDAASVAQWTARIAAAGYREQSSALAERHAAAAMDALAGLDLAPGHFRTLVDMVQQAVARDR
jgi:geranylgeranyl diphosphate synthase type I